MEVDTFPMTVENSFRMATTNCFESSGLDFRSSLFPSLMLFIAEVINMASVEGEGDEGDPSVGCTIGLWAVRVERAVADIRALEEVAGRLLIGGVGGGRDGRVGRTYRRVDAGRWGGTMQ